MPKYLCSNSTQSEDFEPPNCNQAQAYVRRNFSRRSFSLNTAALAAIISLPYKSSSAQTVGCNIISELITKAQTDAANPASWQLTIDPLAISHAKDNVARLKAEIESLSGAIDVKRKVQLLDYADAVGGTLLLLSGFFVGVGPVLIASVAFASTMLVVRSVNSPVDVKQKDFLVNVGGSRLPGVMAAFGEGAGVISKNAAVYGKLAGNVTGAVFVIYSFYQFAQSTESFQDSTVKIGKLKDTLSNLEADLSELEQQNKLIEMRQACAQGVIDDLGVLSTESCPRDPG